MALMVKTVERMLIYLFTLPEMEKFVHINSSSRTIYMAKRIYPDVRQKKNKAVYIGKNGEKLKFIDSIGSTLGTNTMPAFCSVS